MKIVVLAGGTSTERDVSIVSGTEVCKALRSKGHQAILIDVFFGKEGMDPINAFPQEYDIEKEVEYIKSFNCKVKKQLRQKKNFSDREFLLYVKQRMWYFWHFMERMGKTERCRQHLICIIFLIRGPVI